MQLGIISFMQEEKNNSSGIGAISASLYVSFQVIANVVSTKIAVLPLFGWAVDGGTIIYPLTFTLRDFVHKSLGKRVSRQIVLLAGAVNALMMFTIWLVGMLRPDPSWQFQAAYEQVLMPVSRIVMASIIAQVVSELLDTELFSFAYKRFSDTAAVLISNSISLVVDSVVFMFIAFLGVVPLSVVLQMIATNIAIKFVLSLISTPTIRLIPRRVSENEI